MSDTRNIQQNEAINSGKSPCNDVHFGVDDSALIHDLALLIMQLVRSANCKDTTDYTNDKINQKLISSDLAAFTVYSACLIDKLIALGMNDDQIKNRLKDIYQSLYASHKDAVAYFEGDIRANLHCFDYLFNNMHVVANNISNKTNNINSRVIQQYFSKNEKKAKHIKIDFLDPENDFHAEALRFVEKQKNEFTRKINKEQAELAYKNAWGELYAAIYQTALMSGCHYKHTLWMRHSSRHPNHDGNYAPKLKEKINGLISADKASDECIYESLLKLVKETATYLEEIGNKHLLCDFQQKTGCFHGNNKTQEVEQKRAKF